MAIAPKKIKDLINYLRLQGDTDEIKKLIEYLVPFDQDGEISDPVLINIIQNSDKYNDDNKKQIVDAIDKLDYLSRREVTEINAWIKEHEEDIKSGKITKLKRSYTKPGKLARPKSQVEKREFELSHSIVFRVEGGVIKPIALSHKKLGSGATGQVKEAQFVNLKDRKEPTEKFVSKVQELNIFRKEKIVRREAKGQEKVKAIIGSTKPVIRPGEGQGYVVDKAYLFIPKEGLSVDKYIKGNPGLSSLDRLKIAISAFEDLKTRFHDQDIIHRDIKIENMTIDPSSMRVKNIDLGTFINMKRAKSFKDVSSSHQFVDKDYQRIAKRVFEKDKVEYYIPSKAWTASVGTAKAMSPEIAVPIRDSKGNIVYENGKAQFQPKDRLMYSKKSDMYAMGVVLEELSLKGVKEVDILIKKLKDPDPSKRPSVEESLKELQKIQLKLEGRPVVDETASPAKAPAPTASKPPAKVSSSLIRAKKPTSNIEALAQFMDWASKQLEELEEQGESESILSQCSKTLEDIYNFYNKLNTDSDPKYRTERLEKVKNDLIKIMQSKSYLEAQQTFLNLKDVSWKPKKPTIPTGPKTPPSTAPQPIRKPAPTVSKPPAKAPSGPAKSATVPANPSTPAKKPAPTPASLIPSSPVSKESSTPDVSKQSVTPTNGKGAPETTTTKDSFTGKQLDDLKAISSKYKGKWNPPGYNTKECSIELKETTLQITPNEVRFKKSSNDYRAFAEVLVKMHGNARYALFHADSEQLELMRKACADVLVREYRKTQEEAIQQIKGYGKEEEYKAALQGRPPETKKQPSQRQGM